MKNKPLYIPPTMAALPSAEVIDVYKLVDMYINGNIDLICVLGPTASGKTKYAVKLAKQINSILSNYAFNHNSPLLQHAEIISADSRQVYKGMDIGSGKDLCEYNGVPYHLIDIVPAGYRYNIYEYQKDFEAVYIDITNRHCLPILCGGSGLYIKAAVQAYFRNKLDIENGAKVEIKNALNVYYIGVLVDRQERNAKIDYRLEQRLKEGMIEEVQGLLRSGVSEDALLHYGLEYKFVTDYIMGRISLDNMKEGLKIAIHQFAKRQMTWFRGIEREGVTIH